MRVPLARHVLVSDARETSSELPGLGVQTLQVGVLHLEPSGQLLDHETAVGTEQHVVRAELGRTPEPVDRGGVLRNVVGRDADAARDLGDGLAGCVGYVNADPGRPRIAARGTVAGDDQAKITMRRQYSHLFTPSVFFSLSSSMAESFW